MKKRLSIFCYFLLSVLCLCASNQEKEYKKLISKLDVADEVKNVEFYNSYEFWRTTIDNDEVFKKFLKDIAKNKGAEKEALQKTADIPRFYPQYEETIVESMQGFCDTLLMDMGIVQLGLDCSLHIIYSDEINAFTALTEDGFAMCVTTGLLRKKGITYKILMGFVAHEFVHGAFLHHIRGFYAEAKDRRKREIVAGIAIGLNSFSAGLEAYNAAAYGIPQSGTNYGAIMANIVTDLKVSTLKYSFKFSREQEYEADLLAYRFLENLRMGDCYIDGLRILGTEYDSLYSEYSDHPTITSRINFLKYVQLHPELGKKHSKSKKKKTEYAGW